MSIQDSQVGSQRCNSSDGDQQHATQEYDDQWKIRWAEAETALEALRRQEVDAVVGDNQVLLLQLQEVEQQLRRNERHLRELNKSLEERVAERTTQLEEQTQRLRKLATELTDTEQRARKKFAKVLHDGLQQILIAMEFQLALVAMDNDPIALTQVQSLLREAMQASRSLAYELAPPALYESDLGDALRWLARWFDKNHGFSVAVDVAEHLPVLTESTKVFLFHATRELLLNAVKHSGVHNATVRCINPDTDWVRLEVRDEGQGFDPVALQVASTLDKGFGLVSIRERLLAFGGHLAIHAKPGAGAHFVMNFPLAFHRTNEDGERSDGGRDGDSDEAVLLTPAAVAAPSLTGVPAVETGKRGRQLRILLVDDHQIVRDGLLALLRRHPDFLIVGEADDGIAAVQLADQLRPDVVLMDINLPGINGIEATRQIKEKQATIDVIGLSWHEEADMAQSILQAGAVAYLRKETASKLLVETLQDLYATKVLAAE